MASASSQGIQGMASNNTRVASSSNYGLASSSNDGTAGISDDKTPRLAAAIRQRQKERRSRWESKSGIHIDFPKALFSPKTEEDRELLRQRNLPPFTQRMKGFTKKLFKSLVQESLIKDFKAWAAEDSAIFQSVIEDLLDPLSSSHAYHKDLTDVAEELLAASQKECLREHQSEPALAASQTGSQCHSDAKKDQHRLWVSQASQELNDGSDHEMQGQDSETQSKNLECSEASRIAIEGSKLVAALLVEDEEYYELFVSIAAGMLDASQKRDLIFLDHILKCCHEWSKLDSDALHLWHHLRSVKDKRGYNPLHVAVIMGFHEVVERLVLGKYSSNTRLTWVSSAHFGAGGREENDLGRTAETTGQGDKNSKNGGRKYGEWAFLNVDKVNGRGEGEDGQAELMFFDFDVLHARTLEGWTSLHLAVAATGYDALVIHSKRADVSEVDESNRKLWRRGDTPQPTKSDGKARTLLLDALISMYETVEKPVEEFWDFVDNVWMTPLHYAVLAKRHEAVRKLIAWELYHKHVNAGDYHQKTPLHMAVCHSNVSFFQKSSLLSRPRGQRRHLFESYAHSSLDLIKTLAECPHVNIHAMDCCLYTPLHWAVYVGHTEVVRYLVSLRNSKRARATLKDIKGRSVMQMATEGTEMPSLEQSDQESWEFHDRKDHGEDDQMDRHVVNQGVFEDIQTVLLGCDDVKQDIERLYRDRQVYVDATNAILVGAALIASVTFQGWLQPPEPDDHSRQAQRWVRVFWWCNSISFYFSVASVTAGAAAALPMGKKVYIGRSVQNLRYWLSLTSLLLMVSAMHVIIAFAGSGFAALTMSVPNLEKNMIVATGIGMAVCSIIIFSAFFRLRGLLLDLMIFPAQILQLSKLYILNSVTNFWRPQNLSLPMIPYKLAVRDSPRNSHQQEELDDILRRVESLAWNLSKDKKQSRVQIEAVHQLDVLKFVYEDVRKRMNMQGCRRTKKGMERSCCSGLMARGIHHWMTGCPIETCREYSLEVEQRRWMVLAGRVDILYNQYHFLQKIGDLRGKEWFAMCITLHQIEKSIRLDRTVYLSFKLDWYRFCHESIVQKHALTGRDMLHTVGMTIDLNMSIQMDMSNIFEILDWKVETFERLEKKLGRLATMEIREWCKRWERCERREDWRWSVKNLEGLENSKEMFDLAFNRWKGAEEKFERWEKRLKRLEELFERLKDRLKSLKNGLKKFEKKWERLEWLEWWEWWELLEEGLSLETWEWWKGQLRKSEGLEGELERYDLLVRNWEEEMEQVEKKLKGLELGRVFEQPKGEREFEKRMAKFEELERRFETMLARLEAAMGVKVHT